MFSCSWVFRPSKPSRHTPYTCIVICDVHRFSFSFYKPLKMLPKSIFMDVSLYFYTIECSRYIPHDFAMVRSFVAICCPSVIFIVYDGQKGYWIAHVETVLRRVPGLSNLSKVTFQTGVAVEGLEHIIVRVRIIYRPYILCWHCIRFTICCLL